MLKTPAIDPAGQPGASSAALDYLRWFFVAEPRARPRLRLFCFPYAGGWPWSFRQWAVQLPADIEVATVCLPGRGRRVNESPEVDFERLVTTLARVMEPRLDRPYAIFGHSLGALIGFELAGELARRAAPDPVRVFVSASPAPGRRRERRALHRLPDEELLEEVRGFNGTPAAVLQDPELLALTLPLIRADFALGHSHRPRAGTLRCPLTAFYGTDDPTATREAVLDWSHHAAGEFALRSFPGDHFFVQSQTTSVLAALEMGLR